MDEPNHTGLCHRCNSLERRHEYGKSNMRYIFNSYRARALDKGFPFTLTIQDFEHLTSQPCHYCGAPPSNLSKVKTLFGEYKFSGLDRVDNEDGYTLANSRPCCMNCNRAKCKMTESDFKAWVESLAAHYLQ